MNNFQNDLMGLGLGDLTVSSTTPGTPKPMILPVLDTVAAVIVVAADTVAEAIAAVVIAAEAIAGAVIAAEVFALVTVLAIAQAIVLVIVPLHTVPVITIKFSVKRCFHSFTKIFSPALFIAGLLLL